LVDFHILPETKPQYPEGLRVYKLLGIAHGKVITTTLSLVLSIYCMIYFTPNFILEKDAKEV